jgi:hypothetical protein
MRLTVEEHREALKRYRHIKPAPGGKGAACSVRCPGTARTCTRRKGHGGPHVAHGFLRKVVAAWDSDPAAQATRSPVRREQEARARNGLRTGRPAGLRTRPPTGLLEALRKRLVRLISSVEELALLVLFLAFVGFAVHWFLLLLG